MLDTAGPCFINTTTHNVVSVARVTPTNVSMHTTECPLSYNEPCYTQDLSKDELKQQEFDLKQQEFDLKQKEAESKKAIELKLQKIEATTKLMGELEYNANNLDSDYVVSILDNERKQKMLANFEKSNSGTEPGGPQPYSGQSSQYSDFVPDEPVPSLKDMPTLKDSVSRIGQSTIRRTVLSENAN
jgi:hypothetical protein